MPLTPDNQADFDQIRIQIFDAIMADHEARWMQTFGGSFSLAEPRQGMFVKTGPHSGSFMGSIGWVGQIRLGQGEGGSDMVILCHPGNGGWCVQHSNNRFYPLTEAEVELVKPYFSDCLPEDHDFSRGFTLGSEETRAIGFIIEKPPQ